jgi:hypothetical protein
MQTNTTIIDALNAAIDAGHFKEITQIKKPVRTIDKIITTVNCKYGAPMGRSNVGTRPVTITSGSNCRVVKRNQIKIFDCAVPMSEGGYDKGGAYWGIGRQLRVKYTKDLSYVEFYRAGENNETTTL